MEPDCVQLQASNQQKALALAGQPPVAVPAASQSSPSHAGGAALAAAPSDLPLAQRPDSEQLPPPDSQAPDSLLQICEPPSQAQPEGPPRPDAPPGVPPDLTSQARFQAAG